MDPTKSSAPLWGTQTERRVMRQLDRIAGALERIASTLDRAIPTPLPPPKQEQEAAQEGEQEEEEEKALGSMAQALGAVLSQVFGLSPNVRGVVQVRIPMAPSPEEPEAIAELPPEELVDTMRREGVQAFLGLKCPRCAGPITRWEKCDEGKPHIHIYCPNCDRWQGLRIA